MWIWGWNKKKNKLEKKFSCKIGNKEILFYALFSWHSFFLIILLYHYILFYYDGNMFLLHTCTRKLCFHYILFFYLHLSNKNISLLCFHQNDNFGIWLKDTHICSATSNSQGSLSLKKYNYGTVDGPSLLDNLIGVLLFTHLLS